MEEGRTGVEVGDVVGSRWRLTDRLGQGAFGMVYKAEDTSALGLGDAAIKVLHPSTSPAERAAFHDEIRKIVALRHPNLVAYLDSGEFHDGLGQAHLYLVTELCRYSLADYLAGPPAHLLTAEQAERLLADTAAGLAHIHSRGLLHRDLKPANVLLGGDDWKLGDFGLTRELSATGHYHHGSVLMGTPRFMAPELFESNAASPAADVYALGVTFHQALTGRFVHDAASDVALVVAVTTTAPTIDPSLPPHWRQLIERCLARDPAQRPAAARLPSLLAELRMRPPAPLMIPIQGADPGGPGAGPGGQPVGAAPTYGHAAGPPYGEAAGPTYGEGAGPTYGEGAVTPADAQAPGAGSVAALGQTSGPTRPVTAAHLAGPGPGAPAPANQAVSTGDPPLGPAAYAGTVGTPGVGPAAYAGTVGTPGVGPAAYAGTAGDPPLGPAAYASTTGPQPARRRLSGPVAGLLAGLAVIVAGGLVWLGTSLGKGSATTAGTTSSTSSTAAGGPGPSATPNPGASIDAPTAQARLDTIALTAADRPTGFDATAEPATSDEFCVGVPNQRTAYPGLARSAVEFTNTKATQLFRIRVFVFANQTEAQTALAYASKLPDRCNGQPLEADGKLTWRLIPQTTVTVRGADQVFAMIQQSVGEKSPAVGILGIYARTGNVVVASQGSDRPTTLYYAELAAARANGTTPPAKVEPSGPVGGITVGTPDQVRGAVTAQNGKVSPGVTAWLSSHPDADIDVVETTACSAMSGATTQPAAAAGLTKSFEQLPSSVKGSLTGVDHAQLVGAGLPFYCPDVVRVLQPGG